VPLVKNVLAFARLLRSAGIVIAPDQVEQALRGLALVGITSRAQTFAALAATLVTREQDRAIFAQAFALFWRAEGEWSSRQRQTSVTQNGGARETLVDELRAAMTGDSMSDDETAADRTGAWSAAEALAQRDFATLDEAELREVERLLAARRVILPRRVARRHLRAERGSTDMRRTARDAMRRAGEVTQIRYRKCKHEPRRVILLCDVSGSMARYARILLQLGVLLVRQGAGAVDVFAMETRLSYLTRALQQAPLRSHLSDSSLQANWGGGTRLGACLHQFNRDWARRVVRGSALVVILSDGCDRGDSQLLAREMQRLKRRQARIIWVNPLLGDPHYEPLTAGMIAALPYIDDFVPGHNLMRVEALIDLIRDT